MTRRPRIAAVLALAALAAAGCASGRAAESPPAASGGTATATGPVTVFAAASLTDAFTRIGRDFTAAHPGADVRFSFGGSSGLAQQVLAGAPADVFAAASPATMATVVEAGQAAAPRVFARNRLEIAVPPENPGGVTGLADFARPELTLALCADQVPCGAAARAVFRAGGVTPAPDTLEGDVRSALAKVRLGEVDAALVYRTDVLASGGRVGGIPFPEAGAAVNDYLLAPLSASPNRAGAEAFTAYVLSPEGQRVLADAGFETP